MQHDWHGLEARQASPGRCCATCGSLLAAAPRCPRLPDSLPGSLGCAPWACCRSSRTLSACHAGLLLLCNPCRLAAQDRPGLGSALLVSWRTPSCMPRPAGQGRAACQRQVGAGALCGNKHRGRGGAPESWAMLPAHSAVTFMRSSRSWQVWQLALITLIKSPVLSAARMAGCASFSSTKATRYRILGPSDSRASHTRAMVCTLGHV